MSDPTKPALAEEVLEVCDKLSSIEMQKPPHPTSTEELSSSRTIESKSAKEAVEVYNKLESAAEAQRTATTTTDELPASPSTTPAGHVVNAEDNLNISPELPKTDTTTLDELLSSPSKSEVEVTEPERTPDSTPPGEENKPDLDVLTQSSAGDDSERIVNTKDLEAMDWTRHTNLQFNSTSGLEKFLSKVPTSKLHGLKALALDFWQSNNEEKNRNIRIALLKLLKELENMVEMQIKCVDFQQLLNVDMVAMLGTSLRHLQIVDNYPRGSDPISVLDLKVIKKHCPKIEILELNLPMFPYSNIRGYKDRSHFQVQEFLAILPQLEKVEDLFLTSEHSLGTANPRDSSSTDPDYDDAENIMRKLRLAKVGIPFDYISITLEGAIRPRNWRPAKVPEDDGPNLLNYWCPRRVFCSWTGNDGSIGYGVAEGSERVGDINETEEEQAEAQEEYEKYLQSHGDGEERHNRPRFCPGMIVMLRQGES